MFHKTTDAVSKIGTDVEENSLHLIGLEGCFGSWVCENVGSDMAEPVGWQTGAVIWMIAGFGA